MQFQKEQHSICVKSDLSVQEFYLQSSLCFSFKKEKIYSLHLNITCLLKLYILRTSKIKNNKATDSPWVKKYGGDEHDQSAHWKEGQVCQTARGPGQAHQNQDRVISWKPWECRGQGHRRKLRHGIVHATQNLGVKEAFADNEWVSMRELMNKSSYMTNQWVWKKSFIVNFQRSEGKRIPIFPCKTLPTWGSLHRSLLNRFANRLILNLKR